MNGSQMCLLIGQAVVIGTITGLTCSLAQLLFTGDVHPAITAGVTAAVTAALLSSLQADKAADPEQAAQSE